MCDAFQMNLLFQQPSLKMDVSIRVVYIEFMNTNPMSLQESDQGESYLRSFCTFAGHLNEKSAKWDHALLLTGRDIVQPTGDSSLAGVSYLLPAVVLFLK
jgi:hypothetical protein